MSECPGLDPTYAQPGDIRARQEGRGVADVLREGEHVETLRTGFQRVRPRPARKDEAVRFDDVEVGVLLPEQPGAAENEEDLLGATVNVRRRRPHAGIDLNTRQTDAGARSRSR